VNEKDQKKNGIDWGQGEKVAINWEEDWQIQAALFLYQTK